MVKRMTNSSIAIRSLSSNAIEVMIRGHRLVLDQPVDEGGADQGPTPTELFVAALAACSVHYARAYLRQHDHEEVGADCSFETSEGTPHRVTEIDLTLELPATLDEHRLSAALRAAGHCTVHNTLAVPPVTRFAYKQAAAAAV